MKTSKYVPIVALFVLAAIISPVGVLASDSQAASSPDLAGFAPESPGSESKLPASAPGATLESLLARVDQTVEVRRAAIARETALREVEQASFRGDSSLSLTPGVRAEGYDDSGEVDRWSATLSVSATVALGLSEEQQSRLDRARDAFVAAEANLQQVRRDQELRLLRLFHAAWLAEQETIVLERELSVLQEQVRIDRLRFDQNQISWDALLRIESDYREKQADLSDALAGHRSAVIDLALATGLDPAELAVLETPPALAGPGGAPVSGGAATLPGTLPGGETTHPGGAAALPPTTSPAPSPAIIAQESALAAAMREAAHTPSILSQTSIRLGADRDGHSTSLSWNVLSPSLSASYSPAVFVLSESDRAAGDTTGTTSSSGSSSGGSSRDFDWTLSLGVTIGLTGTRSEQYSRETQLLTVNREQAVLAHLVAQEEARLATVLARAAQAERNRASATAALERADVALEIVRTRTDTGQARAVELDQAIAASERALFNVHRAALTLVEAETERTLLNGATLNEEF